MQYIIISVSAIYIIAIYYFSKTPGNVLRSFLRVDVCNYHMVNLNC